MSVLYFGLQIAYLGVVGGKSEMDTVERVLHATIGNEVAKLHNWNGMKGKKALKNLELSKVMFGSVKNRVLFTVHACAYIDITCRTVCWCKHNAPGYDADNIVLKLLFTADRQLHFFFKVRQYC